MITTYTLRNHTVIHPVVPNESISMRDKLVRLKRATKAVSLETLKYALYTFEMGLQPQFIPS